MLNWNDIDEVEPDSDEVEALQAGRKDRAENGTVSHETIDWD